MQQTATTELEAINTMLSVIGESPVNTVDGSGVVDAVLARQILHEVSRHVQSRLALEHRLRPHVAALAS